MTQPDGLFPDNAFNLDSLAELAARPQSEWEAMIRGQTSGGFETFIAAMFGPLPADLREGVEFTRALVTAIIRQILNLPGQIWDSVEDALTALSSWVVSIPADVQARINESLGDLQDALEGNYAGSGPIFLAVQALAQAWLKATDPLNAGNLFGRIALPQFGSGVPIMALTTAVPNQLEPFRATSELPATEDGDVDGWSFNATEDAAQVVCDGTPKALYLKSGVIKVEEGQPLDTSIDVKYSGITSGAGQTIRYVLETFTTDNGSGTATPVIVGAVTNPTGTISTPVTLGDSSWDIPVGVKSVRPVLEGDELITAGTVFWKNTPELYKKLAGPLSEGLPKAIQDRIDDMQATWDKFKGGVGGTVDDIEDALNDAGQAIRDAIANALGHAGTGHTSANILTYLQNIPKTVVDGLEDFWDAITAKTVNITSGGLFDAGKLQNITGTISQSLVTGLNSSLNTLNDFIQDVVDAILSALRGVPIIGGVIADLVSDITGLKSTADTALNTADQIVEDTNAGWTGGTPSGTPTPVYDTITEIKNAVSGVYTIEVKTTSGTWTNPGGIVEFWAICIGSGSGGGSGAGTASNLFGYGGDSANGTTAVGATGGKYLAQQINPADLTSTVSYTVPPGGAGAPVNDSGSGAAGGGGAAALFGSYASSASVQASSIASILGFYDATSSSPGYGGPGGTKNNSGTGFAGKDGASSPLAAGGQNGSGSAGAGGVSDGSVGGTASLTGQSRCGGGGGGGGGGNASGKGGNGGAGGFPGAGGGGGGAGLAGSGGGGAGGNGANGAIILIYR